MNPWVIVIAVATAMLCLQKRKEKSHVESSSSDDVGGSGSGNVVDEQPVEQPISVIENPVAEIAPIPAESE